MTWDEHVFLYCERGLDASFWAEPFNAVSNGAFIVAAAVAGVRLHTRERAATKPAGQRLALWLLIALVASIGVGSFLFHTFATRWALIADVGPITVFMLAYLAYALRIFLGLGWLGTVGLLVAFLIAGRGASSITCAPSHPVLIAEPCLNGSLGYAPALVSLWIIGLVTLRRGHAAARSLLVAGVVFFVSAALRTIDHDMCAATGLLGRERGTHALWHVLNALTLYLLLRAAIRQPEPDRSS